MNTANLQIIKSKGMGNTLIKLEFMKKPVFLAILLIAVQFGPMEIAVGVMLYEIIAVFINSFPTKKLIGYSLKMQLSDMWPNFKIALIMGIIVYLLGELPLPSLPILVVQVIAGVAIYVLLSWKLKNESFGYIVHLLKANMKNKKDLA